MKKGVLGEPQRRQKGFKAMSNINRFAQTTTDIFNPVVIDLLFNDCLPILVDAVMDWGTVKPSLLIETAVEGVMLTSSHDMVKLWPKLWPNHSAADRTIELGVPKLPGFVPVPYHLAGPKMKPRRGYFNPTVIPDPKTWLAEKLGPLAAGR
jgi:hypothetical protein